LEPTGKTSLYVMVLQVGKYAF